MPQESYVLLIILSDNYLFYDLDLRLAYWLDLVQARIHQHHLPRELRMVH